VGERGEGDEKRGFMSSSILIATWSPVTEKGGTGGSDTPIIHTN
jgi:hypothetical protein